MKGKVVMVTGANAGMGKEISLALAGIGANLVMVSRDRVRGEAARNDVVSATGNQHVELLIADMSSQQSIRQLVQDFKAAHTQLHVLVNNAGMSLPTRHETADGIETVFATNHLGPFLLTNLLLPVLIASAPARVVTVSSGVQAMAKIDFEDLQSVKGYRRFALITRRSLPISCSRTSWRAGSTAPGSPPMPSSQDSSRRTSKCRFRSACFRS